MFSIVSFVKKIVHTVAKVVKKAVSKAAAVVKKVAAAIVNIAAPIRVPSPSGGGGGGGSSAGRPSATSSPASTHSSPTLSTAHVSVDLTKLAAASPLRDAPTMKNNAPSVSTPHTSNLSFTGMVKAAGMGCVQTSAAIFIAAGIASIVTLGAASAASAGAIANACVNGAIGGAVTYVLTDGQDVNDTSMMQDVWDYYHQ